MYKERVLLREILGQRLAVSDGARLGVMHHIGKDRVAVLAVYVVHVAPSLALLGGAVILEIVARDASFVLLVYHHYMSVALALARLAVVFQVVARYVTLF